MVIKVSYDKYQRFNNELGHLYYKRLFRIMKFTQSTVPLVNNCRAEQTGMYANKEWLKKSGTPLKEGYVALQAESHPIDFRKIELLNLAGCMDPKAKNYKDYYIKADNSQCSY